MNLNNSKLKSTFFIDFAKKTLFLVPKVEMEMNTQNTKSKSGLSSFLSKAKDVLLKFFQLLVID